MSEKSYYKVYLEVSLKDSNYVFGFINISDIPYDKFKEIFEDQITDEKYLFEDSKAYFIEEPLYKEHKNFFDDSISFGFDFSLFEYSVHLTVVKADRYKKDYYEELPPLIR